MRKIALLLLLLPLMAIRAQEMPPMPADAEVRTGKLANGLTYYVRHNELPKDRADFYIAQRVGSVQEEESQRGLAHFLEHMCFNGTKNFPGNSLISYLESIGVRFGQELNAYTAADETVYNINNVPVTEGHVDSCLLILHDWSNSLLLEDEEIDKERGVIHEEWRLRSSAQMRIFERNLEKLFPGSRYGRRFPIGLMSVIDNFKPDTLRAYYHKWYRPDLQGIVVVGDVDAEQVETKIKELFGGIENPVNEAAYEDYPVPDTNEPIYVIDKDKELTQAGIMLIFKTDPLPREMANTMMHPMMEYLNYTVTHPINARLDEVARNADCPFISASVGKGEYIMSKTKDAYIVSVTPKPGQDVKAVEAAMKEIERVRRYGLLDSEILRARDEFLSQQEKLYDNRNKQYNSFFINKYVRNFLDNSPASSIEATYNVYKQLTGMMPANISSEMAKGIFEQTDTNFVVLALYPEKDDVKIPAQEEMKAAIDASHGADVEPYVDNVKNEPLIAQKPEPGTIVGEEEAPFGYRRWKLSNGATVYFKHTDFDESQVVLGAESFGGYNSLRESDILNARLATTAVGMSGIGSFSSTELQKALAGKQANVEASLSQIQETLGGSATPKDLRTLFELIYLNFTAPGNDVDSYNNFVQMLRTSLENADKNPQTALSDTIVSTLYRNHPLRRNFKLADIDKLDYDAMRRIYRDRFDNPADFTFYFTGNFNEDSLRTYVTEYIAAIPANCTLEGRSDAVVPIADGVITNRFTRKMETPQCMALQVWHGNYPYSLKNSFTVHALGEILTQRYLKSIREESGIAYSVGASASLSHAPKQEYTMQIYCPVKPAKVDSALLLIRQGLEDVAKKGVTEEELNKVKLATLKSHADRQKDNNYWEGLISDYVAWGVDRQTGYEDAVNSVTADDIRKFAAKTVLKQNNCITVVMLPEDFTE